MFTVGFPDSPSLALQSLARVARLIEQRGADMGLPELGDVLRGDCPNREAASVSERCSLYYPQLLRLWECTRKFLDEL